MGVMVNERFLVDLDEGSEEFAKDAQTRSTVSTEVDYEHLYANANQLARDLRTRNVRCGEVLAVHRMFVRLDRLDVQQLQQAERVKRLIVFADVVEIQGSSVALPGSSLVLIVCRVLHLKSRDVQLDLPFAWVTTAHNSPRCSIRAQQVVVSPSAAPPHLSSDGSLIIRVTHDLGWSNGSSFSQYIVRCFGYSEANSNSSVHINLPVATTRPPSFHWMRVDSEKVSIRINQNIDWTAHINFQVALPPADDLDDLHVVMGIESTLLIAEMILSYRSDRQDVVAAALEHTQWISMSLAQKEVVEGQPKSDLHELKLALLARAQMLQKLPLDGSQSLVVPQLEYGAYSEVIREMTDVAEAYNREFIQLHLFIQQNEILGDYILTAVRNLAEKEKDVASLEDAVVRGKEREIEIAMEKITTLEGQLLKQIEEMTEARDDMEQGVIVYRNKRIASATFQVLGAVLQIAGSIALFATGQITSGLGALGGGISSAVAAAEAVEDAASIKASLLNVTDQLVEVEVAMEVVNAIQKLVASATDLEDLLAAPPMPIIYSSAWDIMENEVESVAAQMPTAVSEVPVWTAKCKNVVAVSREVCTTAIAISHLQYELFVHARKQEIALRQAERLAEMQAVDLGECLELASQADMRTTRMLINLLDMLATQNGALQYHYLLPPEPFVGWPAIDSVRTLLVQRRQQAIIAQTTMGPSYKVNTRVTLDSIPVGLLLSGEDFSFTIQAISEDTIATFPDVWSRVRIEDLSIVFTGGHQPSSSTTGEVYLLLQPSSSFHDRLRHQVFNYEAAAPRPFQYAYNLSTGHPTLTSRPHEEGLYLRMTPFTRWRLRLSSSAYQNRGISFPTATAPDSSTEITITFDLTAIVHPQTFVEYDNNPEIVDQP